MSLPRRAVFAAPFFIRNLISAPPSGRVRLASFGANGMAWATLNGIATKANEILSTIDKQFVAGAKIYPKTGVTPSNAVELQVNANKRTAASIGKFGEEDLYQFTAARDGRYLIDTRGSTDVVMKLFGPNSETALIAEDDDSGVDTNALITRELVAGQYFVQVRHYNRASGKGKYSIKVQRL